MCGRYVSPDTASIERAWHIGRHNNDPFKRRFNVAPTTLVPIIRRPGSAGELELAEARWGFVPQWWKDEKLPKLSFNARSEEAATKPMWRQAYRASRCLIPAEGWYEWKAVRRPDWTTGKVGPAKQPYFIHRADRKLVCFAGLMSISREFQMPTCAILTQAAAPSVADVHDRMPVVLSDAAFSPWLDPELKTPERVAAIITSAQTEFERYPVSTKLNTVKDDSSELIEPLPE